MNFLKHIRKITTAETPDFESKCEKTKSLSVWEASTWAVMWGLGESYIAPYALFLGAGNLVMALIGTGPFLISAIAQLLGASLLDRTNSRKSIVLFGMSIQALLFLPMFLLPLLLPSGGLVVLLILATAYFLFFGLTVPPWMSMMGDVVKAEERGSYFSTRARSSTFAMIIAMVLAGVIANSWKAVGYTAVGFGFLFGIAAISRLTGALFFKGHHDAPLEKQPEEEPYSFKAFLKGKIDPNFTRFAFSIALMTGCANISGPFFTVYMLRDLEWSYLLFTLNITTFMLSQTLFVRWWGAIGDKHGNRAVLLATGSLLPLLPILWLFSSNYFYLLWAQVVSGATWSGFNLSCNNFIYDSVAPTRRARAMSYYSVMNGVASVFGGALIGTWIASHASPTINLGMITLTFGSPLAAVFIVSSLARVAVSYILLPQFNEVRDTEHISTPRILWRLGIGQPLFGQVGSFTPLLRLLRTPKKILKPAITKSK